MRFGKLLFIGTLFCTIATLSMANNGTFLVVDTLALDGITKKQKKKENQEEWRKQIRENHSQYFLKVNYIFGNFETKITSELPYSILSAKLGLEEHLGLPQQQSFFTASFLGRFTPGSGFYAEYYGLTRENVNYTQRDLIVLRDTIPAGTETGAYFKTNVFSAGYLLSILKKPDSFLGIYFNVYMMNLNTRIYSDLGNFDLRIEELLPLPNIGLITALEITNWLYFDANVGIFAIKLEDLDETMYDLSFDLSFRPYKWLGISLSYREFDIRAVMPSNDVDIILDYNYRGPALGVSFSF